MNRPALVPELYVADLARSLEFYLGALGFRIEYERPEERFAALSLGGAHLMLEQAPSLGRASADEFARGELRTADLVTPFGRGVNFEIAVRDVDAVDARLRERRHAFLLPLHERSYRVGDEQRVVRQLLVADPDGYLIRLSQALETRENA